MDIREFVKPKINPSIPQISPGDTVKVNLKAIGGEKGKEKGKGKEKEKERLQPFQGVVIRMRRGVDGGSFTVRRVTYGVGVERTFAFQSPVVHSVEVLRHGKVRRAKLYYMRKFSARQARLKERREKAVEQAIAPGEGQEQAIPPEEEQNQAP